MLPVIGPIIDLIGKVLDKVIPDAKERDRLKAEVALELAQQDFKTLERQFSVIETEAKGESWLQRNWRPITMLTFVGLIVARWLGFSAPGMSEAEYQAVYTLMEIGLGGYVVGRSIEKVAGVLKK